MSSLSNTVVNSAGTQLELNNTNERFKDSFWFRLEKIHDRVKVKKTYNMSHFTNVKTLATHDFFCKVLDILQEEKLNHKLDGTVHNHFTLN